MSDEMTTSDESPQHQPKPIAPYVDTHKNLELLIRKKLPKSKPLVRREV